MFNLLLCNIFLFSAFNCKNSILKTIFFVNFFLNIMFYCKYSFIRLLFFNKLKN